LADESPGVRQAAQSAVQAVTESEKPDPVLEKSRRAVGKEIEAFAQPHRTRAGAGG
jgi:hypothetical protein